MTRRSIAIVYGVPAGVGGLGLHVSAVITAVVGGESAVHCFGPGQNNPWPLSETQSKITWHESAQNIPSWAFQYTWWRWYQGHYQLQRDRFLGHWARTQIERLSPELCYVFTQVGLETLRWARSIGIPTILDNPNGHIRHYREVCLRESRRWCDSGYLGHPTEAMVERVEEEYALADRIRVSSDWAKNSMVSRGVPAHKIEVISQPVDLIRFQPKADQNGLDQPLRVCFVGNLTLAKGFIYLTQAIKHLGTSHAQLEIVGATGDRQTRHLLAKERGSISLRAAPGDPVPAYHRAELLVLPSLHDGFGFVVAEAMSCGLPVIVTEDSGACSLVREAENGWVVPSGKIEPLVLALEAALSRRSNLREMGRRARATVEQSANASCLQTLRQWALGFGQRTR